MKIALVHDYLREYGGAERVLEVLHELYPDAPVFTSYYFPEKMPSPFKKWDIRTSSMQGWVNVRGWYLWYTYFIPWAFEQFDLHEYDLVISSAHFGSKGVLTSPEQIHVCYCHTPPRFLWGLNRVFRRNAFIRFISGILNNFVRQWDYAAAARVDHFIANSATVQKRIKKFYQRDSVVIYPPCIDEHIVHANTKDEGYFLVVSRLERVKNISLIVRACSVLNLPLKIAGTGQEMEYLKSIAWGSVTFLGFVTSEARDVLYTNCRAFILAAEDEDFGMTPVEAQSFGKPVIAYRSGGYLETIEEGKTGAFFDELTRESLIACLKSFDSAGYDSHYIRQNALRFSKGIFKSKFSEFIASVIKQ